MPVFHFKGQSRTGENVSGELEAQDRVMALEQIVAAGNIPEVLKEVKARTNAANWFTRETAPVSAQDISLFAKDISRLLSSGFSLHQALQMVGASTESKRARELAKKAADHVGKGGQLSDILIKENGAHVQALAGIVKAGEASGELEALLTHAGSTFGQSAEFKEKLSSALIYPMIILFMISLTLIVFFTFVLPRLAPLFEDVGNRLPLATKLLLGFGLWIEVWMPWLLFTGLALFLIAQMTPSLKLGLKQWWHARILHQLSFGTAALIGYANYSRILGLLLETGVPLPAASEVASKSVRNTILARGLTGIDAALREGRPLSAQLSVCPKVPEVLFRIASLGEQSGKLGKALVDAAGILERKAQTRTDRLLAALTPGITILLGLIVALVVGALFLGIASLTDIQI